MPHESLKCLARLSPIDLPILPFLAPRVFQPWPSWSSIPRADERRKQECPTVKSLPGDNDRTAAYRVAGFRAHSAGHAIGRPNLGYITLGNWSERTLRGRRRFQTISRTEQNMETTPERGLRSAEYAEPSTSRAGGSWGDLRYSPGLRLYSPPENLRQSLKGIRRGRAATPSWAGHHHIKRRVASRHNFKIPSVDKTRSGEAESTGEHPLTEIPDQRRRLVRRQRLETKKIFFEEKYMTTRTKYSSLGRRLSNVGTAPQQKVGGELSELNWFSSIWTKAIARLNATYDPLLREKLHVYRFGLYAYTEDWVQEISSQGWHPTVLRSQWQRFMDRYEKPYLIDHHWQHIMIWIMYMRPEHILDFLEATDIEPRPSSYCVVDALEYAVCYQIRNMPANEKWKPDKFFALLEGLNHPGETPSLPPITQNTIYHVMQHCDQESITTLHNLLSKSQVDMHRNTLLQLAQRYAELGQHERSLSSLQAAMVKGAATDSEAVLSVAATILRQSAAEEYGYQAGPQIIAQIINMGIKLNTILYNITILNAVEAGDLNTAWRIYDLLHERNNHGSAYTYAIILKACKASDDPEQLTRVIRDARNSRTLHDNPVIVTEMLHCVYLMHQRRGSTDRLFHTIRRAYCNYFQTAPIDKLGLHDDKERLQSQRLASETPQTDPYGKDTDRMEPASPTLGIMLTTYVETCNSLSTIRDIYSAFRQYVCDGDPIIAPLAENDYAYNLFIKAFGRSKSTLHLCTQILKDMTAPLPSTAVVPVKLRSSRVVPETASDVPLIPYRPIIPALPTVQTWTILAQAFIHHGQAAAAEKVLKLMQGRQVEPNDITWNILVAGYAKLQDVEGVVEAMRRMESSGYEMGGRTLNALGRVADRKGLMSRLAKATQEKGTMPDVEGSETVSVVE